MEGPTPLPHTVTASPATKEVFREAHKNAAANFDLDAGWRNLLDRRHYEYQVWLMEAAGIKRGSEVLDIGSGFGVGMAYRALAGFRMTGVEPGEHMVRAARALLADNGATAVVKQGVGEDLPFPDDSFDAVVSFQVFEHVQDPARVMQSGFRVLRPGGVMLTVAPNYNTFYEGHWHCLWWPWMSHDVAERWLKLLDRLSRDGLAGGRPETIREIVLVTPAKLREWSAKAGFRDAVDLGPEVFAHRVGAPDWMPPGTTWMKPALKAMKRTGVLRAAASLVNRAAMYPTCVVVARK